MDKVTMSVQEMAMQMGISMRNAIIHGEIEIPIVIIPLIFPSRLFFFRGRAPQTI